MFLYFYASLHTNSNIFHLEMSYEPTSTTVNNSHVIVVTNAREMQTFEKTKTKITDTLKYHIMPCHHVRPSRTRSSRCSLDVNIIIIIEWMERNTCILHGFYLSMLCGLCKFYIDLRSINMWPVGTVVVITQTYKYNHNNKTSITNRKEIIIHILSSIIRINFHRWTFSISLYMHFCDFVSRFVWS